MNNNQMNFDPMTGQPINQNTNNANVIPTSGIATPMYQTNTPVQPENTKNINSVVQPTTGNAQQLIQSIPTIEQSKHEFIDNTQANILDKKEDKKDSPNITFIIILFIIILAAIFFLFPYLQKTL